MYREDVLTEQEKRILVLAAQGNENRQIGKELGYAEKTIKNYMYEACMKLGVSNRTQAVVFAYSWGMIEVTLERRPLRTTRRLELQRRRRAKQKAAQAAKA